ncbi:MAG: 1-deoxy-D-xylulose-5-phosphate synthase, partial [Lachnospiraceae bacterium]|nr:1-deoxy-D-xylulose-5-phosphate synthase [Lachnospiraceae bacterium]
EDKVFFDVGHQCYTHKILTGRREGFDSLRQYGGMSGFPRSQESPCDIFDTGHSSTSISTGLGLAQARDMKGENYAVVSIIGDGSMTGGLAFEALNNAGQLKGNLIIVINDNDKSIGDNVGGMSNTFQNLRTAPRYNRLKQKVKNSLDKIPNVGGTMVRHIGRAKEAVKQILLPNMYFESMGLTYLGPIDGHNVPALIHTLQNARRLTRPVVVHVVTRKGRGYAPAESDPERFHGIDAFDLASGKSLKEKGLSYTDVAGSSLLRLGSRDDRVCAITAAMAAGTGLIPFQKAFPERFFDVGIAEQHAVAFSAGLAKGGFKPYVCIYSTFLQRAYDQIIHDVALQKLPVTFLIDRAGLVGADGPTHHGMQDAGFLQTVPGLTIMAPRDARELEEMLDFSLEFDGPLAIRYPRGDAPADSGEDRPPLVYGKAEVLEPGSRVLLFAMGQMVKTAGRAAELLKARGISPTMVNGRFARPFDKALLREMASGHSVLAILEEGNRSGALGEHIADFCEEEQLPYRILNFSPEDAFYPQGDLPHLYSDLGLSPEQIAERILQAEGESRP